MPKNEPILKHKLTPTGAVTHSAARGGSMDHGALTGRGDPDHPQYLLLTTVFPSVRVYNSGDLTIPDNTVTLLTFDSETWDTAGFHSTSTNTGRLTVPAGYAGTYLIIGQAQFFNHATGQRIYEIRFTDADGTSVITHAQHTNATGVNRMAMIITTVFQMDVDEYVEFHVYQNRGGDLNVKNIGTYSPHFMMIRLGPK